VVSDTVIIETSYTNRVLEVYQMAQITVAIKLHYLVLRLLVVLTRRFVHQIPACKKGPNLKTKDLRTHVYMNLYNCFWTYNSPLKFVRLISNHSVCLWNWAANGPIVRLRIVHDEHKASLEWYWQGKRKNWEENLSQHHFVHHKSHMDLDADPGLRGENPATNHLSYGTAM
jgi:hypothetical protein